MKKLIVAGAIGMYFLAIAWLLVDYVAKGISEIWGFIGALLLGLAVVLYVRTQKTENPRVADLHFMVGFGALILGTAMIAYSGFGARGVSPERRDLMSALIVACGLVTLAILLVIRRRERSLEPR